jgi:hypothetical protein
VRPALAPLPLVAVLPLVAAACGGTAFLTVHRTGPLLETPSGTRIALVEIAVDTDRIAAACDEEISRERIVRRIVPPLRAIVRQTPLVLVDRTGETGPFSEPLQLTIHVEGWPCTAREGPSPIRMAFTIATRDGEVLDAQTVSGALHASMPLQVTPRGDPQPGVGALGWFGDEIDQVNGDPFSRDPAEREQAAAAAAIELFWRPYGYTSLLDHAIFEDEGVAGAGAALARKGRFTEALESWQAALREQPDDAKLLFNIGMLLDVWGHERAALPYYTRAVAADPTKSIYDTFMQKCAARVNVLRAVPVPAE